MLVQLWRSPPHFCDHSRVSTRIYRVCLNTALTHRRDRRRREARVVPAAQAPADTACPGKNPAETHDQNDQLAALIEKIRADRDGGPSGRSPAGVAED